MQSLKGQNVADLNFDFLLKFCFLPVLFITFITYMIVGIFSTRHTNKVSLTAATVCIVVLQLTNPSIDSILLQQLCIVPYALLFYTIGNIAFPLLNVYSQKLDRKSIGLLLCISFPVLYILSQFNTPVKMYANEYGNILLFLLSACLSSLFIIVITHKMRSTSFIDYAGRYSVAIYVWQFVMCDIARNLGGRLLHSFGSDCKIAFAFTVSTTLSYLVILITLKYVPQMYSIKKKLI